MATNELAGIKRNIDFNNPLETNIAYRNQMIHAADAFRSGKHRVAFLHYTAAAYIALTERRRYKHYEWATRQIAAMHLMSLAQAKMTIDLVQTASAPRSLIASI